MIQTARRGTRAVGSPPVPQARGAYSPPGKLVPHWTALFINPGDFFGGAGMYTNDFPQPVYFFTMFYGSFMALKSSTHRNLVLNQTSAISNF